MLLVAHRGERVLDHLDDQLLVADLAQDALHGTADDLDHVVLDRAEVFDDVADRVDHLLGHLEPGRLAAVLEAAGALALEDLFRLGPDAVGLGLGLLDDGARIVGGGEVVRLDDPSRRQPELARLYSTKALHCGSTSRMTLRTTCQAVSGGVLPCGASSSVA